MHTWNSFAYNLSESQICLEAEGCCPLEIHSSQWAEETHGWTRDRHELGRARSTSYRSLPMWLSPPVCTPHEGLVDHWANENIPTIRKRQKWQHRQVLWYPLLVEEGDVRKLFSSLAVHRVRKALEYQRGAVKTFQIFHRGIEACGDQEGTALCKTGSSGSLSVLTPCFSMCIQTCESNKEHHNRYSRWMVKIFAHCFHTQANRLWDQ